MPCTQTLREQYLQAGDIEYLQYNAEIRALGMGVQVLPPPVG